MHPVAQEMVIAIITSVLASSGLWAFIQNVIMKRSEQKSAIGIALQCLLRDRILQTEKKYKQIGYCDPDEKTNLQHMYSAYKSLGGNDVASKAYHSTIELPSYPPKERKEK